MSTVTDFRHHNLRDRVFKIWQLYRAQKRRSKLMLQVADEFRNERINALIHRGKKSMRVNKMSGVLINQNQELMQQVFINWQFNAHINRRNNYKLSKLIDAKRKLMLVKVFLSWRSIAKFETSEQEIIINNERYSDESYL